MIQKLIDKLYRYPLSSWHNKQRFGGYWRYKNMLKSQKEMILKSYDLPSIVSYPDGFKIYFLTGKKYLYQTLFCAYSLNKFSSTKFQFVLVDDGSFDGQLINRVKKQMPNIQLVLKEEITEKLDKKLPENIYPYLRNKRNEYPHIKKLTDIHTIDDNSYKLVLDSDMIFWSNPSEIISWLEKPNGALYMLDCEESYGYSNLLMQSLTRSEIPKLMNVGVFGINSSIINWNQLELWTKTLEEKEGASYFLEQALSAMLIADLEKTILNKEKYIVNPVETKTEPIASVALHHYVDLSKKHYFENAWKIV